MDPLVLDRELQARPEQIERLPHRPWPTAGAEPLGLPAGDRLGLDRSLSLERSFAGAKLGSSAVARRIVEGQVEFNALSERHLRDAKILLDQKRPQGAVYLAGYAAECILKARISLLYGIPRWTKDCLDYVQVKAWSHDLVSFATLANASPQTMSRVSRLNWDTQLRYHPEKIPMHDGVGRHALAAEIVGDIRGLMGIV